MQAQKGLRKVGLQCEREACFGEESLDEACDRGGSRWLLYEEGKLHVHLNDKEQLDGDVILSLLGFPLVPYYDDYAFGLFPV